jgi:hypothetical protein
MVFHRWILARVTDVTSRRTTGAVRSPCEYFHVRRDDRGSRAWVGNLRPTTIEGNHPMPAVKKRRQSEEDLPDEQFDDDEEDDEEQMESSNSGIQVNIYEDTLVVELPRDGNEAETLSRVSKFVDGM